MPLHSIALYTVEFLNGLRERKVTILNNKNIQIMENNMTLNLVGVDDVSTIHENSPKAFNNVYQEQYTILLSHSPGIMEKYNDIRADLILSGHTHGGQVRIPYIGALVAPNQGFFPKLDKGTYQVGPNQYLYIDSGLGTSIAPIRFLNQSQLSLIKIKNRQGDRDLSASEHYTAGNCFRLSALLMISSLLPSPPILMWATLFSIKSILITIWLRNL